MLAPFHAAAAGAPGSLAALETAIAGELEVAAQAVGETSFTAPAAPPAAAAAAGLPGSPGAAEPTPPPQQQHGAAALLAALWPTLRLLVSTLPRSDEVVPAVMSVVSRALDAAGPSAGAMTRDALLLILSAHAAAPSAQTLVALGTVLERHAAILPAAVAAEAFAAALAPSIATLSPAGVPDDPLLLAELFRVSQTALLFTPAALSEPSLRTVLRGVCSALDAAVQHRDVAASALTFVSRLFMVAAAAASQQRAGGTAAAPTAMIPAGCGRLTFAQAAAVRTTLDAVVPEVGATLVERAVEAAVDSAPADQCAAAADAVLQLLLSYGSSSAPAVSACLRALPPRLSADVAAMLTAPGVLDAIVTRLLALASAAAGSPRPQSSPEAHAFRRFMLRLRGVCQGSEALEALGRD